MSPCSSRRLKTCAHDLQADDAQANKRLPCESGPDSITLDTEGKFYLTGRGVIVFDKTRKKIAHIEVLESQSANVGDGNKEHKTLFITAS